MSKIMTKIERILFYSFVTTLSLVLDTDDSLVSAQELPTDMWTWTPLLASVPTAVMGAINLVLVSRLANNNNRNGMTGITRFLPGLSGGGGGAVGESSNKMVFLGRHNIQVSNHKDQSAEAEDDYEDDDEDDDEDEDDYEDDDEDDEEDEEEDEDNKDKYKDKKNKYNNNKSNESYNKKSKNSYNKKEQNTSATKNGKGSQSGYEKGDNSEYEKEDNSRYGKDDNSGYGMGGEMGYGGMNDVMDLDHMKQLVVQNALSKQYPSIDQSKVFWPQTDESVMNGIQSDPNSESKPNLIVGFPKTPTNAPKGQTFLPVFKQNSFSMPELNAGFYSMHNSKQENPEVKNLYNRPNGQQIDENSVDSGEEEQYSTYNNINNHYISEGSGNGIHNNFNAKSVRTKRSTTEKKDINRVGNVPPLRHDKTSKPDVKKMSPQMVKLLLEAVNNNKKKRSERKGENKNDIKGEMKKDSTVEAMSETKTRIHKKSMKKASKKWGKKKLSNEDQSDIDLQTKPSVNRVVTTTKPTAKESAQPIKFVPLKQYKHILNYSAERKSDNKKYKKKKTKYEDNDDEEEDDDEDDDEDEDCDDEDDCNGVEDDDDEGDYYDDIDSGHVTVQMIHKPDEKFNTIGVGGWMKRMLGFGGVSTQGRRRGIFRRGFR